MNVILIVSEVPNSSRDLENESKRCIDDIIRRYEGGHFVLLESNGTVYSGVKQDVTTFDDVVLGLIIRVIPQLDRDLVNYLEKNKGIRRYQLEESIAFRSSNHAYVSFHDGVIKRLTDKQSNYLIRHLPF